MATLALWGGASLEQLSHLDLIASLGIRTLRVPLTWGRVAPHGLLCPDWRWADERLERMRALGIKPVLTLVQRGACPALDAAFAEGLAELAAAVAERYPWVTGWTPVDAPLSLALEQAGEQAQLRALCRLLRGTALAMEAVRAVNAAAQLVQSEAFRATHATPALRWRAEVQNELRWASLDLLTGRFERNAALQAARVHGSLEAEALGELCCSPDLVVLDYGLERERLLDERGDVPHGGGAELVGPLGALQVAWRRFGLPLALETEPPSPLVGERAGVRGPSSERRYSTRDDQLRWLDETHRAVEQAQAEGVDAKALVVTPLLGPSGAFDVRGERPRQTALAYDIRARIGGTERGRDAALDSPGWWRREARRRRSRPLLIIGAPGSLARALAAACQERGLSWFTTGRAQLDAGDVESVARALQELEPWAVINAAGFTRVDAAEAQPAACHRENAVAPALLAMHCGRARLPFVTFSSDLVFDGRSGRAYVEDDRTNPLSEYGRAKSAAERHVLHENPRALVVRTGALFGGPGSRDFAGRVLSALERGAPVAAAADHVVSPAYVPDLANGVLDLLFDRACGLWHLTSRGHLTCEELARELARRAGYDAAAVRGLPSAELHVALRPRSSVLSSRHGDLLPSLSSALARFGEAQRGRRSTPRAA